MRNRIKQIICFLLVISCFCVSCSSDNIINKIRDLGVKRQYQLDFINKIKHDSLKSFEEFDEKRIQGLFCNKVRETIYLKNKINKTFEFINNEGGIIFDNRNWTESAAHGRTNQSGWYSINFKSISLDNVRIGQKVYTMTVSFYDIFEKHPEYIGIINIGFVEKVSNDILIKINKANKKNDMYLGIDVYNVDFDLLKYCNVLSNDSSENIDYIFSTIIEDE